MITALIQFKLPQPVTREKAKEIFLGTAPKYRTTPGLVRKYFLLSDPIRDAVGKVIGRRSMTLNRSLHGTACQPPVNANVGHIPVRLPRKLQYWQRPPSYQLSENGDKSYLPQDRRAYLFQFGFNSNSPTRVKIGYTE